MIKRSRSMKAAEIRRNIAYSNSHTTSSLGRKSSLADIDGRDCCGLIAGGGSLKSPRKGSPVLGTAHHVKSKSNPEEMAKSDIISPIFFYSSGGAIKRNEDENLKTSYAPPLPETHQDEDCFDANVDRLMRQRRSSLSPYPPGTNQREGSSLKICVLGPPNSGKTALIVRYLTGRFIWEYSPEDQTYNKQSQLVGHDPILVEIKDWGGMHKNKPYSSSSSSCCPTGPLPAADGYLAVFSLTDAESFRTLQDRILPLLPIAMPCILVANKQDLGHLIEVPESDISSLSELWNLRVCYTSAREDGDSVIKAFDSLGREILGDSSIGNSLGSCPSSSNSSCGAGRKRRASLKILESFNKMIEQIGLK